MNILRIFTLIFRSKVWLRLKLKKKITSVGKVTADKKLFSFFNNTRRKKAEFFLVAGNAQV